MKILAIEKDLDRWGEGDHRALLKAEAAAAWDLHQAGAVRELYFREDRHEAVLVLECADVGEAERALARLPLVAQGFVTFDLIPLVAYPGFARLFANAR